MFSKLKDIDRHLGAQKHGGVVLRLAGMADVDKVVASAKTLDDTEAWCIKQGYHNDLMRVKNEGYEKLAAEVGLKVCNTYPLTKKSGTDQAVDTDVRGCHYSTYEGRSAFEPCITGMMELTDASLAAAAAAASDSSMSGSSAVAHNEGSTKHQDGEVQAALVPGSDSDSAKPA